MIGDGFELTVIAEPRENWWQAKLLRAHGFCVCGHEIKIVSILKIMAQALTVQPYSCSCGRVHSLEFLVPIAETIFDDGRRTASLN